MNRRSLLRLAALLPTLLAALPALAQPVTLRDIAGREAVLAGEGTQPRIGPAVPHGEAPASWIRPAPFGDADPAATMAETNRRALPDRPLQGTTRVSLR